MADDKEHFRTEDLRLAAAYDRRKKRPDDTRAYTHFAAGHLHAIQTRERAALRLLSDCGFESLSEASILEVGCGTGHWLRQFVQWGAQPAKIVGVEALAERVEQAQRLCDPRVRIEHANARRLDFPDDHFDIVVQSTVFSSILDSATRAAVASEMCRVLKPDGVILWYDFYVKRPGNPDTVPMKRRDVVGLFPGCSLKFRRVTLAPPIARVMAPYSWSLCELLYAIPLLRTHYLTAIRKFPGRP